MTYDEAMKHCIYRYTSGSNAYGTNILPHNDPITGEFVPGSDEDKRSVFIAPLHYGFNLFQSANNNAVIEPFLKRAISYIKDGFLEDAIEQIKNSMIVDGGDVNFGVATVKHPTSDDELMELRKFFKLAAENNPNVIEYLYINRLIDIETPIWKKIKASAHLFLSKKIRFTFSGYAFAQLKRIQNHRGYVMNGEPPKPIRAAYGLPEQSKIPPENQNAILSLSEDWVKPEVREEVIAEKKYMHALRDYRSYRDWETKRNPARREIERKFGFDLKHAMHLVRLVDCCKETLETGVFNVYRPDREKLMDIRNGKWTYDQIIAYVDAIEKDLDEIYKKSTLQNKPNHAKISELYKEICCEVYGISL